MISNHFFRIGALAGIAIATLQLPGFAQSIRSDGSLGTTVQQLGENYTIRDGTFVPGATPNNLNNLFHSFEQFNLERGEIATFENVIDGLGVDIIFARVTGGGTSVIDGTINGGDVNLFLMNPSGLVFNENASLQIGRSFFGVTADSISFFDNSQFSASRSSGLPTGEVPRSFIFNGNNGDVGIVRNGPGGNAEIEVDIDRTFALIGSNARISNIDNISAPSGRIEIVGVGSQSSLDVPLFVDPDNNLGISFEFGTFPVGDGQVLIENTRISSEVDSAELNPNTFLFTDSNSVSNFQEDLDAGGVFIRASDQILIRDSNITAFTTSADANAGYVGLQTSPQGQIILSNGDVFANVELRDNDGQIVPGPRGQGGAVLVDTGDLTLQDSSQLQVLVRDGVNSPDTFAGTVYIQATGTVRLEGNDAFDFPAAIFASAGSSADDALPTQASAGLILMDVGSLEIDASNGPTRVETSNYGEGSAGIIIVDADNDVVVRELGGFILSLAEDAPDDDNSFQFQEQSPGFILIGARRVGALNGGEISANSQGTAAPGRIGIIADLIALNRGVPFSAPNDSIRNTGISAENSSGQGGLIALDSGFLALANGSSITTISNFDPNGDPPDNFQGVSLEIDYEIIASPSLNNDIAVDASGFGGRAGTIEFEEGTRPFLRNIAIQNSSPVTNDISFNGEGGASDGALLGTFSEFSSFQPTAEPAPDTVDPSRLIAQGCAAGDLRAAQNIGNLTLTGREGLAATPEEQLAGTVTSTELAEINSGDDLAEAEAWATANSRNGDGSTSSDTVEAQTWRYGERGQVILAANSNQSYSSVFSGFTCNAF